MDSPSQKNTGREKASVDPKLDKLRNNPARENLDELHEQVDQFTRNGFRAELLRSFEVDLEELKFNLQQKAEAIALFNAELDKLLGKVDEGAISQSNESQVWNQFVDNLENIKLLKEAMKKQKGGKESAIIDFMKNPEEGINKLAQRLKKDYPDLAEGLASFLAYIKGESSPEEQKKPDFFSKMYDTFIAALTTPDPNKTESENQENADQGKKTPEQAAAQNEQGNSEIQKAYTAAAQRLEADIPVDQFLAALEPGNLGCFSEVMTDSAPADHVNDRTFALSQVLTSGDLGGDLSIRLPDEAEKTSSEKGGNETLAVIEWRNNSFKENFYLRPETGKNGEQNYVLVAQSRKQESAPFGNTLEGLRQGLASMKKLVVAGPAQTASATQAEQPPATS